MVGAAQAMETAVADSQVCDWVLRGEGGANIVLGYTGNHPSLVGAPSTRRAASRDAHAPGRFRLGVAGPVVDGGLG